MVQSVSRQGDAWTSLQPVAVEGYLCWVWSASTGEAGAVVSLLGNPTGACRSTLSGTLMTVTSLSLGKLVFYQVSQFSGQISLTPQGSCFFSWSASLHCRSLYLL